MRRERLVQLAAAGIMVLGMIGSGALLPHILENSEQHSLRYTDISVEGAPPFVALGTAIGALRGVIVDYLWIKVNIMKEKGLYYEVMADSELITKLQPRFASVWAFNGHNMAYNISVACDGKAERWEWVKKGIRLVRNEGLRYNPNDLVLHKELAFWFAHKIEGNADDAHHYYKTEFCREWHMLLGEPPDDRDERTAWIKRIADAPKKLEALKKIEPKVAIIIDRLKHAYPPNQQRFSFALNAEFLTQYTMWEEITHHSAAAQALGMADQVRKSSPYFVVLDELASDPEFADAWSQLLAHVRKRVLIDEYNMDPGLMYEYTRDLGPIDWRHGQAHALYWSRKGEQTAQLRVFREKEIYKVLNNDSIQLQAMQGMARGGRIYYDPFSNAPPSRMPDPRWVDAVVPQFEYFYNKHYKTRGTGSDRFIGFLENFLSSAVRDWFRRGERERAQKILDLLDEKFGMGNKMMPKPDYAYDLEVFVRNQVEGQYEAQPPLAISDVAASLHYGFRLGLAQGDPELMEDAIAFADEVRTFFRTNDWFKDPDRYGELRIGDLLGELDNVALAVFSQLMIDRSIPLEERMTLWREVDKYLPQLQHRSYDYIHRQVEQELKTGPFGGKYTIDQILPEPPDMAAYREQAAAAQNRQNTKPNQDAATFEQN